MNIRDHGVWELYKPQTLPKDRPPNAMFARRAADGMDWYDYAEAGTYFAADSIKMTVMNNVVAAVVRDPTMLFPAGTTVLEVSDVSTDDPQKDFGNKIYDALGKAFKDKPPPEAPEGPSRAELLKRIEALESRSP